MERIFDERMELLRQENLLNEELITDYGQFLQWKESLNGRDWDWEIRRSRPMCFLPHTDGYEFLEDARIYESASKVYGKAIGRGGMLSRTKEVPKLLVAVPAEKIDDVIRDLRNRFRNEADVMQSSPTYIEIVRPGVSKARAMLSLAEQRGICAEEIMALGDSGNDIEMIRAAGLGVAMGNAIPAVKEAANEIAPPCEENGFAKAVRRFVLEG